MEREIHIHRKNKIENKIDRMGDGERDKHRKNKIENKIDRMGDEK